MIISIEKGEVSQWEVRKISRNEKKKNKINNFKIKFMEQVALLNIKKKIIF